MKFAVFALALVTGTSALFAQPAPRLNTKLSTSEINTLETVRKAVWVDWFSGDTTALKHVLSPDLVAMSAGASHWQSLPETVAASVAFKADGGKFVSVAFDSTAIHRFGETVVMFSQYKLVTEKGGSRATQNGRATEVFVREKGSWVHTSWHLDRR